MTGYPAPAGPVIDYQAPYDAVGLLPAAWAEPAEEAQVPRQHRVLASAILLLAVGASLAFPVAGAVAAAAGITVLRAADRAAANLATRREARGPRAAVDPFVLAASVPWLLARSVIETIVLAPLVLLTAAIPVVVAIIALGGGHLTLAIAALAGIYTVLSCLGPRSRPARRQLHRILNAVAHAPLAAGATTLALGALAAGVIVIAIPGGPTFWPTHGLPGAFLNLPGAGSGPCQASQSELSLLCAAGGFDAPAIPASAVQP
jgi:hypothetical protein